MWLYDRLLEYFTQIRKKILDNSVKTSLLSTQPSMTKEISFINKKYSIILFSLTIIVYYRNNRLK